MLSVPEQLDLLKRGTVTIHSEKELAAKLAKGKPLRIKLGVDPTSPDIHLGHAVALRKLRQFQDLGHQIVLIIGDFTAMIGDPSGRSTTRPPLTYDEVLANAKTYTDQAFLVIDKDKTEVVFNGNWFKEMPFMEVIKLNARVTLQQMLQREDFKNRVANGTEVRLHEIQYPIMQGWDSVVVRSDVEIGGSDQLFNILVGRDLQKEEGMEPQVCMTLPLLEGLDGVKKMSKSLGNYVGLTDAPKEMFGKLMSIRMSSWPNTTSSSSARNWRPRCTPWRPKKPSLANASPFTTAKPPPRNAATTGTSASAKRTSPMSSCPCSLSQIVEMSSASSSTPTSPSLSKPSPAVMSAVSSRAAASSSTAKNSPTPKPNPLGKPEPC